jgi:PmbA protein
MEKILEEAKKVAEAAEVFLVSSEEISVKFESNRLKHIQSKQSQTIALRIIKKGRIGYTITSDPEDVSGLINAAVETAEFGAMASFNLPGATSYPQIDINDSTVEAVTLEEMTALGKAMIAAVTAHNPEILCEASVTRRLTSVNIINSRGCQASYKKSTFSLGLEGNLIRGTDMLFIGESQSSCHPITEVSTITDEVLRQLEWAKGQATVATSKELPVIFTANGIASAMIPPLMAAFNGKTVLEGASPIAGSLGQQIFNSKLWLWDDATIPYRPGSRPHDDEGVASQRTPLIAAGTVASFIYDMQTAGQANTRSTANGSRTGSGLPTPSPSAFTIDAGDTSFDDMLADIREGLVIEYVMGASQGNILGGDFSGNVLLGYMVKNGRIEGRVKNTMVSGNIYQVLKEISAVGIDTRWVGGFLNSPSIYCPSLSVAVKQ